MSILMPWILVFQAIFGGYRGVTAICFGGGPGHHHHSAPEELNPTADTPCQGCCGHDEMSSWPKLVASDGHDGGCTCTDVALSKADLAVSPRDGLLDVPSEALWLTDVDALITVATPTTTCVRGPPDREEADPGGECRLRVVRSTRLII